MEVLVGRILEKISIVFPLWALKRQCHMADRILSTHADDQYVKMAVIERMNKFLKTMPEIKRRVVMSYIGVQEAPKWVKGQSVIHTGDE